MTLPSHLLSAGRQAFYRRNAALPAPRRLMTAAELNPPDQGICIPKVITRAAKEGHGIKIGIFAGIHGDEEAGTLATHELIRWAQEKPEELDDYELHFYPVCNPTGSALGTRHSHSGLDLNREFWFGSIEPEIIYLEAELRREKYDGIISLHSDDTSDGCYGFVSGALLTEHLLEPALQAAADFLPRNELHIIDGFLATRGIIKEGYLGILSAPPEQHPRPLEIVFETPALAPMAQQVDATVAAVKRILAEYRELQAYAANL
ncbi:MAG TPA: succinylglutamate desuccinylase/aspartoacylase family protein [Prosthecobacter sp.]